MKFKYYLRGCGIGILCTAIILMISFRSDEGQMTDSQVMERTSELGMIAPGEIVPETENSQAAELTDTEKIVKKSETGKTKDTESVSETGEKNTEELEVVPDFDTEERRMINLRILKRRKKKKKLFLRSNEVMCAEQYLKILLQ